MQSNSVQKPLRIYIDENLAPQFAQAFNTIQEHLNIDEKKPIEVFSIKEVFGQGCLDEDWIPKVGAENGIVITNDRRIQQNKHQKELYTKNGVGVIFLHQPKNGLSFWDTFKHLVQWWDHIKSICKKNETPFAFRQPGQKQKFELWN